jgi:hypothetical protein
MTVIEHCADCDGEVRPDDRFCPRCGGTANAAAVPPAPPREFQAPSGALARASDFALAHVRILMAAGAVAVIGVVALLFGGETRVPETPSSPGYEMVRALQRAGAIDAFEAIEPEDGWDSEYSLDRGEAHLRFRGDRHDDDLKRAIEAEARREGFGQNDSAASSAAAAASTSSAAT